MIYETLKLGDVIYYTQDADVALLLVVSINPLLGDDVGLYDVKWLNLYTGEICFDSEVSMKSGLGDWEIVT